MNQIKSLHHGGDYNPDQWLDQYPDIIEKDFALMKEARTNTFSLNIFGWTKLEPKEGQYNFGWLDQWAGFCPEFKRLSGSGCSAFCGGFMPMSPHSQRF